MANYVSLQASNGQYVCAEDGGGKGLSANRTEVQAWEVFRMKVQGKISCVALKTDSGKYVGASNGGGEDVTAKGLEIKSWETFQKIVFPGNKVAFRAHNGQFVGAQDGGGGKVMANQRAIGDWEKFTLVNVGRKHALKASNGQYVCAEKGGGQGLVADRNEAQAWELFEIIEVAKIAQVFFRSAKGQYVGAAEGGGGAVDVKAPRPLEWETFQMITLPESKYAFQTHRGYYLGAQDGGGREVVANQSKIGDWEKFSIKYYSQRPSVSKLGEFNALGHIAQNERANVALHKATHALIGDVRNGPLNACHEECLTRLTNVMIAMSALSTGMIARDASWKDSLSEVSYLVSEHIVSGLLEVVLKEIPIVSHFILLPMQLAKMKHSTRREKKKRNEFLSAASLWRGGLTERELLNRTISYIFVYSRQNQIRSCSVVGAKQLGEKWVNEFVYSLLKASHKGQIGTLNQALTELQAQGKYSPMVSGNIEQADGRMLEYDAMRNKAGISYLENGEKKFALLGLDSRSLTSKPEKYNYLHFNSKNTAFRYAKALGKSLFTRR